MNTPMLLKITTLDRYARLPFRNKVFFLASLLLAGSGPVALAACAPPPADMAGWWRAEGDAANVVTTNLGTLYGQATFGTGVVGECFVFDGNGDGVRSGTPGAFHFQDFSIEAWVKRSSLTLVTSLAGSDAAIVSYGGGGYGLGMDATGRPWLSRIDVDAVYAPTLITNLTWHHLAVTKSGSTVVFYLDGIAYPATTPYGSGFTFTSDLGIGARGDNLASSFLGAIDEPAIYSRPLNAAEVQAVYNAGASGKCFTGVAPQLVVEPADRGVVAGDYASFQVLANGTSPLVYQWTFEGTNLAGATGTQLAIPAVSAAHAGNYAAIVTNNFGAVTSRTAVLTLLPAPPCAAPPEGLAGWWRGEGNTWSAVGANEGTLQGQAGYGAGRVGQCFVFDGNADGVGLGNVAAFQLQDFTLEAWVSRSSASQISGGGTFGQIISWGGAGYGFGLDTSGRLFLSQLDASAVFGPALVTDTGWHHVAVTKAGATVIFYTDGVASAPQTYTAVFSFPNALAIGARGDNLASSFLGAIDEPSIYSRPLTAVEVQAIHAAGVGGKCFIGVPPQISVQPTNRSVVAGDPADFSVVASGTAPLSYQWLFEGTNLAGATSSRLLLHSVSPADAGQYSATVLNPFGAVTSLTAVLTIVPPPPCTNPPVGLVGWWRASQDALDTLGGSPGTVTGNVGYGPGKVGYAFSLDGSGDAIRLGRPANLQLQDFTIEAWVKRASALTGEGAILCYGQGGYGMGMDGTGRLYITRTGIDGLYCTATVADASWHHVALTKAGATVIFYIDGVSYPAASAFNSVFTFTTEVAIGARGDSLGSSFNGWLDEVSVYARALTASEVQAIYSANSGGKCVVPIAPLITAQPSSQSVPIGASPAFTVRAVGTPPLAYQWTWFGTNLAGATGSTLTLPNVQLSQAGQYAATVSNAAGSADSSNALLTVTLPPANIRVVATSGMGGGLVTVPVEIVANGDENALQFSLNYSASLLTFDSVELGPDFVEGTLFVNSSQTANGRLGIVLALPTGTTLPAGTREVVRVSFNTAVRSIPTSMPVSFGDVPTIRQLVDVQAATLSATYSQALVTLTTSVLEADTSPRPNGDTAVTVSDWVLLGRYAARLEYPTNASEFQRADCAPRTTRGDGSIKVTDWVQAGRYTGAADPLTVVGGPSLEGRPPAAPPNRDPKDGGRLVQISGGSWFVGQTGTVSVVLQAQGNESALGFSLAFDPALFTYVGAVKGTSSSSATLNVNTSQAAAGKIGFALALSSGSFPVGGREMVRLTLRARPDASAIPAPVSFTDLPVPREVSDPAALPLAASYVNGTVTLQPRPTLQISHSATGVTLSWPLAASNFTVKSSSALNGGTWSTAPGTPTVVNGQNTLVLPAGDRTMFYRLLAP
jgi:hypothetical protein